MKALFLLGVALFAFAVPSGTAQSPPPAAPPAPAASPTPGPAPLPLSEIAPQGQTTLGTLNALEPDDAPDQTTATTRQAIRDLTERIDSLVYQGSKATLAGSTSSLDVLRDLLASWKKLQDTLDDHSDALGKRGGVLEKEAAQVEDTATLWQATKTAAVAKDANVPPETLGLVNEVLFAAKYARKRIQGRRTGNLELQTSINAVNARIAAGLGKAQQANAEAVKTLLVAESEPIWTPSGQPRPDFFARWRESSAEQWGQLRVYADQHWGLFVIHGAIFAVLLGLLLWLRRGVERKTEEEPYLQRAIPIFRVPVATALALSFLVKGNIYAGAPTLFRALLGACLLVPTVVILRRVLDRRLSLVLYSLVVFYAVDQLRLATAAFPATNRWIFCVEMAAAIVAFLLLTRAQRSVHPATKASLGRAIPWLNALAIAILATALGASVLGYVRLGTLLGRAVLVSSYLAVFLFTLLRVLEGLIALGLRIRPFSASRIAKVHGERVQTTVYRLLRGAAMVVWCIAVLDLLQVRATLFDAAGTVLDHEVSLGAVHLTLGRLLAFGIAIWASILVSRVTRFFLDEEVYDRIHLSPGLPYAISTMLNYLILVVGFLVALGSLGVDLTKITIVAGAFSVGLGFGLQNIINNFVSGIILLFERPVKVGDVIQIGDAVGEVRRIGIRASIIRTRDGSDVILPNGNLISNQVTNWTYGDRSRAVEIPLNIAAGADAGHVLELLQKTTAAQPGAEDRPAPKVYITALNATGLTVVVRVWTDHYEDWIQLRSDLSAALAAALARENIKLV